MKKSIQNKTRLLGAALLLGALSSAGSTASAANILQTVTEGAGLSWNQAHWGTPAAVPVSTNDYETPSSSFAVRTPNVNYSLVAFTTNFLGNSLKIDTGGILYLKHGAYASNAPVVNLKLNGGAMTFHGGFGPIPAAMNGTLQVLANSTINTDQSGANAADILLLSPISGSSNLTLSMINATTTNSVVLSGNNSSFTGNWTNFSYLVITNGTGNALGSGSVTLVNPNSLLTFNSTNDQVVNNSIGGAGPLVKGNTNTVTLGGNNSYAGATVVSNGVLKLTNPSAITNSASINLAGGTIDASAIGGLTLNAANSQSMNCKGTVTGNFTVGAANALNFTVTGATNDILNVSGLLSVSGTPTINVTVPAFKAAGTYRLINYTGAALPVGAFNLNLVGTTAQPYALSNIANQVNLVVQGAPKNLTWTAGNSGDWDTTTLNWTNSGLGLTNFTIADNVFFDDSAATFSVNIANGTIPLIAGGMTVSNVANAYTFYGDGLVTVGTLTKKGAGMLSFTSPSNNITGPIDIQGGIFSIGVGGGFGTLGTPAAITNNGDFQLNLSGGGVAVNAPISGSGTIEVLGASVLTLTGSNSYTGFTTVNDGCQLYVSSSNGLGSASSGTRVLANGKLAFNTASTISIPEPLFVNGMGIVTVPTSFGALYAINANTRVVYTGPVTVESDSRFRMVSSPVSMTFSNTVTGNNVNLWCTPGSAVTEGADFISFENALNLGAGGSLLKDGPGVVNLDSTVNTWGSTVVSNGTLSANNALNGGNVTVYGGALGGSGTVTGAVSVQPGGSIAPGNNGIGTLTINGALSYASGTTNTIQINRTNAQNADKLVSANIPLSGTVLNLVNIGPALQFGDSFDLFDGSITGPIPTITMSGNGFAAVNYVWDTSQLLTTGVITVTTNKLPLLPLQLTKIDKQPATVGLTWNSFPSVLYTLQYSLDLFSWSALQSNIVANSVTNLTSLLVDISLPVTSSNYTLAQYQMGTVDAQIQDKTNTVSAGSLTAGSGLALFNAAANVTPAYPTGPQLQVTPNGFTIESDAYNGGGYFTFSLTVGTNVTDLGLTSLAFNAARGGAATPRGYGAYVTLPDNSEVQIKTATDLVQARPTWDPQSIDLSGVTGLQHLTAGQTVTFKITLYSPSSGSSLEFDDITVKGNVSPGVPAAYAGAKQLFFRLKQQ